MGSTINRHTIRYFHGPRTIDPLENTKGPISTANQMERNISTFWHWYTSYPRHFELCRRRIISVPICPSRIWHHRRPTPGERRVHGSYQQQGPQLCKILLQKWQAIQPHYQWSWTLCTFQRCRWINLFRRSSMCPPEMIVTHEALLKVYHDTQNHFGVAKTYRSIMKDYFWPGIVQDMETYTRSCDSCARN